MGWVAAAAVCIAVGGLVIVLPDQIGLARTSAPLPSPEPFTELHFSESKAPPRLLSLSGPSVFGFTVVNHEGHDGAYSYVVTLADPHGSSTIAQGSVELRNDTAATRLVSVPPPARRGSEYLVTVSLQGRSEKIWFRADAR